MSRKKKGSGSLDAGSPDAGAAAAVDLGSTNDVIEKAKRQRKSAPRPAKKQGNRKGAPSKAARKAEIERAEKIREALDYRRQGYTYAEIGEQMGVALTTARNWVREGIEAIPEEAAEEVRKLELDRIDLMQSRIFSLFLETPDPAYGEFIMKCMDKRAKYLKTQLDDPADDFFGSIADRMKEMVEADRPILRPDAPVPANPVL